MLKSLEKIGGDAGIRTHFAADLRGSERGQVIEISQGSTLPDPAASAIKSQIKSHDVYQERLKRKAARAKAQETYFTRRRHALARVRKAVPKARACFRAKPAIRDETIHLDLWVTMDAPRNPLGLVSVPLPALAVPFDLTTPEIVRLIRVRARLAQARKGT